MYRTRAFASLFLLVAFATSALGQEFGYPGSALSSVGTGTGAAGEYEVPGLDAAVFGSNESLETASLPGETMDASFSSTVSSDPFDDLNRTLTQPAPAAAPVSSNPKFRVIATAQGDIGLLTATGARMKKWSEGAALPSRRGLRRPIQVQYLKNGASASCTVLDVGPWNTRDPYWEKPNGRPQAETGRDTRGRRTNRAGIDLYNATWYKLLELRTYDRRLIENTTGEVEWQFNG